MTLPDSRRQSTEVNDSWQIKIKAVEAAINRSAADPETSQMIRNGQVKLGKKVANSLRGVNANRTSRVRGGPNREGLTRILINGPAVEMIRTERVDRPDLSRSGR